MNLISLKNFKSYQSQLINNLSPHVNIIIGKNGEGKSNFFKAISFIATDKISINKSEYNSYLHKAMDNDPKTISVEAYIKNTVGKTKQDENLYRIQRTWSPDVSEQLKIQDDLYSKDDFQNFIQSLGISYSNSYNIIQQGKVTQVAQMNQYEIFTLFQEATGMRKFEKRHQQVIGYMTKNNENKEQIKRQLTQIESRLAIYEEKKAQFEYSNFQEINKKVRSKREYEQQIKKVNETMDSERQKETRSSDYVNEQKNKLKQLHSELDMINQKISINQKQMYNYVGQADQDEDLFKNSKKLTQSSKELNAQIKKINLEKEKLKNQLQKVSKQTQKAKDQMQPFKQKYEILLSHLEAQKFGKEDKGKAKIQLKKIIDKSRQNLKQIDGQLIKINKYKSQYKIRSDEQEQQKINSLKQRHLQNSKDLKATKIKFYQLNRVKNQVQSQIDVVSRQAEVYYSKMRKILPLLDFNLLKELKKCKIKGVYGFFIEFLQIQPGVAFAYELAALSKLCTLLVQDEEVVRQVVEINKKIKGKQVNILPLSFVKRQANEKKNLPNSQKYSDCFSLLNSQWIKIKKHEFGQQYDRLLQKIISNTFNKHCLVRNYEDGLKISKEYHLNCITADKQIVYSDSYLCKVGKDENIDNRIQIYFKFEEKNNQSESAQAKLTQISKDILKLQNDELQLTKKKFGIQNQLANVERKIQQIKDQKRSFQRLQSQSQSLQQKQTKIKEEIARKQSILSNFDNKKDSSVNMKQYKELQQTYKNKLKIYNQYCEQEYELQTNLANITKQQQGIKMEAESIDKQISFKKQFKLDFIGQKQYKESLSKQELQLDHKRKITEDQVKKLEEQINNALTHNYEFLGNLSLLEEQRVFYYEKLKEIGQISMTEEEMQQKSNSFSRSRLIQDRRKKTHIYTARQKLLFSKIDSYNKQYQQQLQHYRQLEDTERQIKESIASCQKQKDVYLNKIFTKFEKEFDRIFRAVTVNGRTDVRFKKVTDKSRGFIKYKNSIAIMVSFENQRQVTRNWKEFSGGQKTVISFCILMALQQCEPALFYVLDEIDSALDPIYLQRIVQLIKRESEHSQYFITSFKREMYEFPEQICHYYLVEMIDRVSTIKRKSQSEAQLIIDQIVN